MATSVPLRILSVVALLLTALSSIGWMVFVGGWYSFTTTSLNSIEGVQLPISTFTGPSFDPYWIVSVLSPFLFLVLGGKAILMCIKDEVPVIKRFFVIQTLAAIGIVITVIVLCFIGYLLVYLRILIQLNAFSETAAGDSVNAMFAGSLMEVVFLGASWIFHVLAHFFVQYDSNRV